MSITWNGVSSDTIGVVVERIPNRYVPTRRFSPQQVAGRNGNILLVDKSFPNVEQEYEVYLSAEAQGLPSVARACAEWLMGPDGYCRLEDSYDTTVYREAFLMGGYDLENILNKFGRCTITFSCKPQKYLLAGDTPIEIPAGSTTTYTGSSVQFDGITGASITSLSATIEPIQDLHGYSSPWPAGGGKNKLNFDGIKTIGVRNGSATWGDNTVTMTATSNDCYLQYGAGSWSEDVRIPVSEGDVVRFTWTANNALGNAGIFPNGTASDFALVQSDAGIASVTVKPGYSFVTIRVGVTLSGDSTTYSNLMVTVNNADTTYAPYSNICPITGRTGLDVYDDPKYGGTIEWNQLIVNGNFDSYASWNVSANDSFTIANNVATYRASARYHNIVQGISPSVVNHVYLGLITAKSYTNSNTFFYIRNVAGGSVVQSSERTLTDTRELVAKFIKLNQTGSQIQFMVQDNNVSGFGDIIVEKAQLFDITEMFGSTIADYIYNLERETDGAGVAWFSNLFQKDYYPYDNSYTATCVSAVNGDPYWEKTVDWTSEAGTVYGGTLDVVTGVLTVDRAGVDLGTLNWSPAVSAGITRFRAPVAGIKRVSLATELGQILCSNYATKTANQTYSGKVGISQQQNTNDVYIYDPQKEELSVSDFKAAMSGVMLVYELATPLTYQLTPQEVEALVGTNNIWTSSGDVSVTVMNPLGGIVTNPTPFEARPMLEVSGVGEITINGKSIQILESVSDFQIDCEAMEAEDNSKIYCMDFPELSGGENEIVGYGSITALTVTPRWWTL